MKDIKELKDLEKQMKALANVRRLAILRYLKKHREASVGDIAGEIRLSFKSTSRHLSVLFAAVVIEREQRSVMMFYSIAGTLHPATKHVIAMV